MAAAPANSSFKGDEDYARLAFASPAIDGIIDKKHRRPVHPTP
jgi:hypothetical protein